MRTTRTTAALILTATLALAGCTARPATTNTATEPAPTAAASTPASTAIEVPDLTGQLASDARDTLTTAGFTVKFDAGDDFVIKASNWTVTGQDTTGTAEPGTTITLTVEKTAKEDAANTDGLADAVWAQVQENFPGGIGTDSPLYVVTQVEDVSTGTIRVYAQETLDDEGRDMLARHVFNMGAMDNTALQTVVVRDATGIDSNHYRRDYPHLPQ